MASDAATTEASDIIFDGCCSISISLYMALVGYTVMVIVPVLSTVLVGMLGFTEEQIRRVWGTDLGGLSLGAIMTSLLVSRINRRLLVMAGVVLNIGANVLCICFSKYDPISAVASPISNWLHFRMASPKTGLAHW